MRRGRVENRIKGFLGKPKHVSAVRVIAKPHRIKASHRRRGNLASGHRFYILNNPLAGTDPTGYCSQGSDPATGTHICGPTVEGNDPGSLGGTAGSGHTIQVADHSGEGSKSNGNGAQAQSATVTTVPSANLPSNCNTSKHQSFGDSSKTANGGSQTTPDDSDIPEDDRQKNVIGTVQRAIAKGEKAGDDAAVGAVKAAPWFLVPDLGIAKKLGALGRWLIGREEKVALGAGADGVASMGLRRETPNILKATNGEMSNQARMQIAQMSGTTAQKAAEYERLAKQIEAHSGGSWGMSDRILGTDGSISYRGRDYPFMITIAPDSRVFSGSFITGMSTNGTHYTPIYESLREIK